VPTPRRRAAATLARPFTDAVGGSQRGRTGERLLVAPGIGARVLQTICRRDNPDIFSHSTSDRSGAGARGRGGDHTVTAGIDPLSGEHGRRLIDAGLEHQMWWAEGRRPVRALGPYARPACIGVWRLGREDPFVLQQPLLTAT